MTSEKLIRLPQVVDKTGIKKSTISRMVENGTFPKPVKLSERSIAWVSSEIDEWIHQRIKQSRG